MPVDYSSFAPGFLRRRSFAIADDSLTQRSLMPAIAQMPLLGATIINYASCRAGLEDGIAPRIADLYGFSMAEISRDEDGRCVVDADASRAILKADFEERRLDDASDSHDSRCRNTTVCG